MSKHIETKHKIKEINSKSKFNDILEDSMLNDNEKKLMKMYYIDNKSFDYISDELGYSLQGVSKMHKRILKKIEKLI